MSENEISLNNHVLVCIDVSLDEIHLKEYQYLKSNFCGQVLDADNGNLASLKLAPGGVLFVCGNAQIFHASNKDAIDNFEVVKIIKELSHNAESIPDVEYVTLGQVPITLHNAAVYYRDCLGAISPTNTNYFDSLQVKHKFQALTEGNKPGKSFRNGIYLSEVQVDGDTSKFHLLRCSTNLDGPTLAFADEDREILTEVNKIADCNFKQKANLNHVLAQVYNNTFIVDDADKVKERKAKIRSHSDKTKDMPANGLIAFCTFYSSDISDYKAPLRNRFDRCYKDSSVLTKLKFKLKDEARHLPLVQEFSVPLYPNSVLLIPLSTNRYWTHETCPPSLPVGKFPTRLGYVIRCSNTSAVFRDGATYIQREGKEDVKLEKPVQEDIDGLKKLYQAENTTINHIEYKDIFFSMNEGDYKRPIVES